MHLTNIKQLFKTLPAPVALPDDLVSYTEYMTIFRNNHRSVLSGIILDSVSLECNIRSCNKQQNYDKIS